MATRPKKDLTVLDKLPRHETPGDVVEIEQRILSATERQPVDVDAEIATLLEHLAKVRDHLLTSAANQKYATTFARGYIEARAFRDLMEEYRKLFDKITDAYIFLTGEQLTVEGAESVRLEGGINIKSSREPVAYLKDPEAFHQWCKANGLSNELKLSMSWGKMNSITKDLLYTAQPAPDGLTVEWKYKLVPHGGNWRLE